MQRRSVIANWSHVTQAVFLSLVFSFSSYCDEPQKTAPFLVKAGESLSQMAAPGPYFRISLMLSPRFASSFGGPREQLYIRSLAMERLSVHREDFAALTEHVTPATSEDDAKAIFVKIKKLYFDSVVALEEELRVAMSDSHYDQVLQLQLGLCELDGFDDIAIQQWLKLSQEQIARVKNQIDETPPNNSSEFRRTLSQDVEMLEGLRAVLTTNQWATFQMALNDAKELIAEENNHEMERKQQEAIVIEEPEKFDHEN